MTLNLYPMISVYLDNNQNETEGPMLEETETSETEPVIRDGFTYDIYISYPELSRHHAHRLADILKEMNDNLSVYIGKLRIKPVCVDHLQNIYVAVSRAHCVVSMLCPEFISSPICNDEFAISLARHNAQDSFLLVNIHTGAMEKMERRFNSLPCIDMSNKEDSFTDLATKLVALVNQVKTLTNGPDVKALKETFQSRRAMRFTDSYCLVRGHVSRADPSENVSNVEGKVFLLHSEECSTPAAIFSAILRQHSSAGVECSYTTSNRRECRDLMQHAGVVVVFMSDSLASDQSLLDLLFDLYKLQQREDNSPLIYYLQTNHSTSSEFYLHALPFSVSLEDNLWHRLGRTGSHINPRYKLDEEGAHGLYRCTSAHNIALTVAVLDVMHLMVNKSVPGVSACSYNMLNVAQTENEVKKEDDDLVFVHEHILSLASINYLLTRKPQSRRTTTLTASKTKSFSRSQEKAETDSPCPNNSQSTIVNNGPVKQESVVVTKSPPFSHEPISLDEDLYTDTPGIHHDLGSSDDPQPQGHRFSRFCHII